MREPAGLYVHVPFCTSVCPYCDFAVTIAGADRRRAWLAGVAREATLATWEGPRFDTLYLGGGTPSVLASDELVDLLGALRRRLPVAADCCITLEANPEHATTEALDGWRDAGVRTLSLGVQSFDDRDLAFLGRRHDGVRARQALTAAVAAGFDVVSADLIFGLPGQGPEAWRRQLDGAVALGARHLSCYQLTVHGGTVLGRRASAGRFREAPEGAQAELFHLSFEHLGRLGWQGYEVSSFAATAADRSRHNRKYWTHVPYLGLGPSAHSFDGRKRWWNHRKLRHWQRAVDVGEPPVEGCEELSAEALLTEAVMLAVRTADGLDLELVRARHGLDLERARAREIADLERGGLLRRDGAFLRPTVAGLAVADAVARALLG